MRSGPQSFVLSGFVIAFAFLDRLWTGRSARVFVIRRVGRVWPLHVVLLAVLVCFELARMLIGWARSSPGLFFVENRAPITILWDVLLLLALGFVSHAGVGRLSLTAPLVFAALIVVFSSQAGALSAALCGRVGALLGDLSYSICMTALLVSMPFNRPPLIIAGRFGVDLARPHPGGGQTHMNCSLGSAIVNDL